MATNCLRGPRHLIWPWDWVQTERIAPLIEQWLAKGNHVDQLDDNDKRLAFAIRHHERESVHVGSVDRLLVRMDLQHYWHLSPEDGGLADIYYSEPVGSAA